MNKGRAYVPDEFGEFCEDFTEAYKGWIVAVVSQAEDGQWRVIADDQVLQVLSYQVGDGRVDIRIVLGAGDGESLAVVVSDARRIDFQPDANGAPEELRIGSENGTTSVRFRSPAHGGGSRRK